MTRQLIPEFLVSFDHLVAKAAEFNLALVDSARFDRYYKPNDRMDAVQKAFSFLNRFVVFKKI